MSRPSTRSGGHSVRRNGLVTAVPRALQVVTGLALTPFIISKIGLSSYGLYSLVQTAVTYLALADLGFPSGAMRLVARARARGSDADIRAALNVTMGFMLGAALVTIVIGAVAGSLIAHLWTKAPAGTAWLVRWTALGLAITFITKAVAIIPQGFNRWDFTTAGQVAGQLVAVITVTVGLLSGGALPILGASFALAAATVLAVTFLGATRVFDMKWGPRHLSRTALRTITGQGANLFVVGLVEATSVEADQLMLLPFASLRFIGLYSLGLRVAAAVRLFALSVLGPLSTHIAALEGSSGMDGVRRYYPVAFRKILRVCVIPMSIAACASYPAVLAWLGAGFRTSALVALLLGIGFSVNMLTGAGTATAAACGHAALDRNYSLLNLAMNVSASAALGILVGRWGVLAGTLCGLAGSAWVLIRDVDRWLGIRGFRIALDRLTLRAGIAALAVGGVGAVAAMTLHTQTRWVNLALACATAASALLAALCAGGVDLRALVGKYHVANRDID